MLVNYQTLFYTVSINPIEFWYIFDLRSGWSDQVDILEGENRDR